MGVKILGTGSSATLEAESGAGGYTVVVPKNGVGKVLQVVSAIKTDTMTTTSATFIDTGITVDITPSATSSRIHISGVVPIGNISNGFAAQIRLMRDSTPIQIGDAAGSRSQVTGQHKEAPDYVSHVPLSYIDSPATVSTITYKVQIQTQSGGTAVLNRNGADTDAIYSGRLASIITITEIGA